MRQGKCNAGFSLRRFAAMEKLYVTSLRGGICVPTAMTSFINTRFITSFHLRFGTPIRKGESVFVFMTELELRAGGDALDG